VYPLKRITLYDKMYVQNYRTQIWEKGEIFEKLKSPRSYKVQMENCKILRRNVTHISKRKVLSCEGSTTLPLYIDKPVSLY